ncbi:MAG: phosphopantetheine-binding protein, partial [Streptosporangiaceae bacterium]
AVVADVEWDRFGPLLALARPSRLLDTVPAAPVVPEPGDNTSDLRHELAAAPETEREGRLLELVRTHVAAVLRYPSVAAVDPALPFKELGFDSLAAVELRNRLRAATGLSLPTTLVFDHPTPSTLAAHLLLRVLPEASADPGSGHLDEVETALAALSANDPRRASLVNRLQALVWRFAPASTEQDNASLDTASADEMFALLDRELGA